MQAGRKRVSNDADSRCSQQTPAAIGAPGRRALDFGCGIGGWLDALAADGWETTGIEPGVSAATAMAARHGSSWRAGRARRSISSCSITRSSTCPTRARCCALARRRSRRSGILGAEPREARRAPRLRLHGERQAHLLLHARLAPIAARARRLRARRPFQRARGMSRRAARARRGSSAWACGRGAPLPLPTEPLELRARGPRRLWRGAAGARCARLPVGSAARATSLGAAAGGRLLDRNWAKARSRACRCRASARPASRNRAKSSRGAAGPRRAPRAG